MKVLVVLSAIVAVSVARPGFLHSPFAGNFAYPYAYSPLVAPTVLSQQHHAQDVLGQYNYGYTDGLSTKGEVRTADGVTRGAYSYVDNEGKVQNVAYTADAAGFRVSASNLPEAPAVPETPALVAPTPVEDTAEVAAAKIAHEAAFKEAETLAAKAPEPVPAPAPVVPEPAPIEYSSLVAPGIGYSAIAPGSGFAYSTVAAAPITAPALRYSPYGIAYSPIKYPEAGVPVLTPAGVPVDTLEVQAARAADYAAHLRVKGLIL